MPNLICIKAFGDYVPGDDAGFVPDDAEYCTDFFAPVDEATTAKGQPTKKQIEAELAALEGEAK